MWEKKFVAPSDYPTTLGWSGRTFAGALLKRIGLLAIAREPKHCGGQTKMQQILRALDSFVFDGQVGLSA